MISLKSVTIHKYKCIESDQSFEVDSSITVLVGMNESGKTSVLEALAKTNYFTADERFKFNTTHDYPRKEKKRMEKSGIEPKAVTSYFEISSDLMEEIKDDLGDRVFTQSTFSRLSKFDNKGTWLDVSSDSKKFIDNQTKKLGISSATLEEDPKYWTVR